MQIIKTLRILVICIVSIGLVLIGFVAAIEVRAQETAVENTVENTVETKSGSIDFNRDIRPLLSENCFHCHGPDDSHREADLRLDREDAATEYAFVAGSIEESEALERITTADPDLLMPPPDSGRKLTGEQIELLKNWVQEGANWEEHWAFVAPERPPVPTVSDESWIRNPIDSFVLAGLEAEGLQPRPEADANTLLRRYHLGLTGLPPNAEQIREVSSGNSNANEALIDQLLASPHYGESWGRRWLDAARYADSNGYEKDAPREVWFYRDWVINALNKDLPYDRFVIEQIAGDLLPGATQDQRVATGFLRNSMINEEGGADPEQFRMEAMYDRMDAIGKSILGLTIQCAQCHSHKFDPIDHAAYYQMFAFLNNSDDGSITVYTPTEQKQRAAINDQFDAIIRETKTVLPKWREDLAQWEREHEYPDFGWSVPEITVDAGGGPKFLLQDDGAYLVQSYSPPKYKPIVKFLSPLRDVTAFRLEVMTDPNLPRQGPGRAVDGTAVLSEFKAEHRAFDPEKKKNITSVLKIQQATSDLSVDKRPLDPLYDDKKDTRRTVGGIELAVDGKIETGWTIDSGPGQRNQSRQAVFQLEKPLTVAQDDEFTLRLEQQHGGWNGNGNENQSFGRFRISISTHPNARADSVSPAIRSVLNVPRDERTEKQNRDLFIYWVSHSRLFPDGKNRVEHVWRDFPEGTSQLVYIERDAPRITHRLDRGDFLSPAEQVEPGVPDFLHPLPQDAPLNRLTFARWLVDPNSPTAARVLVNRVWQAHFGIGLVSTSGDFGSQAEAPSHPELLDWLAIEFMESGWSMKQLHKLILNSATYRQSSHAPIASYRDDPHNRKLARGARFRVDAEVVRDIALSASGLLNTTVGGPSVHPPAPGMLFLPPASYGDKAWPVDQDRQRYRRAMYTFSYRSVPFPSLETFDAPNGNTSCVRRSRSNTPLQALTTLNEPLFLECAQGLARRVFDRADDDAARLELAFELCTARKPNQDEQRVLLDLLDQQRKRIGTGELDPEELTNATRPKSIEAVASGAVASEAVASGAVASETAAGEIAPWIAVARVILNLDETITSE